MVFFSESSCRKIYIFLLEWKKLAFERKQKKSYIYCSHFYFIYMENISDYIYSQQTQKPERDSRNLLYIQSKANVLIWEAFLSFWPKQYRGPHPNCTGLLSKILSEPVQLGCRPLYKLYKSSLSEFWKNTFFFYLEKIS